MPTAAVLGIIVGQLFGGAVIRALTLTPAAAVAVAFVDSSILRCPMIRIFAKSSRRPQSVQGNATPARHFVVLSLLFCLALSPRLANAQSLEFRNPILRGGYPDPSIVRVGDDFYIVNSTFEYFPGLPIHHSRDLVNWTLAGHGIHDPELYRDQVNLVDVQSDGGIHAPSIRWHDALFHIITTNVYNPGDGRPTRMVNFIITAEDVAGPWSEPHVIEGAPGIDPDIFFDDDGKVWYVGNHGPDDPEFAGQGEIWLQQLDPDNWQLIGERHFLWRGACDGTWAEGPHIYKRDGRYYLLIAEGGTSYNHAVMIAVSDEITGPYIANDRNPILTSRNLSYGNWVHSTGHADMVELADGRWYMVALGKRNDERGDSNMGRESHLIPVEWEREPFEWKDPRYEWPVAAPATGRVERSTPLPFEDAPQYRNDSFIDDFDSKTLALQWNFRRVPLPGIYSLSSREGYLRLHAHENTIRERGRAALMGVRQRGSDFQYSARMEFNPERENAEAGISLFQKDDNFLNFTVIKIEGEIRLRLSLAERGQPPAVIEQRPLGDYAGEIIFRVVSRDHKYRYEYSLDRGNSFTPFTETDAARLLSRGYTGAYLGLYSTANGNPTTDYADFDWVRYEGYERK